MWSFGKWLIPSSVGEFMAGNSDRLLFAALLDKEVFGLYAVAFIWVQAGSQIVNRLAGSIFLPVFSEVKRNHAAGFGRMVRRSYAVNAGLSLLLFAATFLVGVYVVGHLYVGPFAEVGVLVAAMAFKVLFLSFRPLMQVILSEGDSRYVGITQLSRGLLVVAAILIGAELGSIPYAILLQIVIVAGPIAFMLVHPMVAQRISPRITLVHLALLVGATVAYFQLEGIAGIAALTR
jgi:O-antigen/teichoic acid export membrane protein